VRVQRATQGFIAMILAHALEQQRRWGGVEATTKRCLQGLGAKARAEARSEELGRWKEVVRVLEAGMTPLLTGLESAEHIKKSTYATLREPLNTMFKELNENYMRRDRFTGQA